MRTGYFDAAGDLIFISEWDIAMSSPPGASHAIEVPSDATANNVYYSDGAVKFKQPLPIVVVRNSVSGIPPMTEAIISGDTAIVDDGLIEFEADVPGTIRIDLTHPHYLAETVMLETGP